MSPLVRLALLAGAAYLLTRYWQGGRSALLSAAGAMRPRDPQRDALAPLGGLRPSVAGQSPLPTAPELHTS
jgi:hypothetical protein